MQQAKIREKVIGLLKNTDMTMEMISVETGYTACHISKINVRYGVRAKRKQRVTQDNTIQIIKLLRTTHLKMKDIAELRAVSVSTISRIDTKYNIRKRIYN